MQSLKAQEHLIENLSGMPHAKVVIVYEDFASGLKAKQLFDQFISPSEAENKDRVKMWDFGGLRFGSLRERAVEDASAADVVCISLQPDVQLPGGVKDWAEDWARQNGSQGSVLVVLLGLADDLFANDTDSIQFLRKVANMANA